MVIEKPVTTILSDLGNVVVGFDNRRTAQILSYFSPYDERDVIALLFEGATSPFVKFEKGELAIEQFRREARKLLHLRSSFSDQGFDDAYSDVFTFNEEVVALWDHLRTRGLTVVAVSNVDPLRWKRLQEMGIEAHLDRLALSFREKVRKPDPELIIRGLDAAGAAAEEAVYTDDVLAYLAAAAAMNVRCHQFRGLKGLRAFLGENGLEDLLLTH